MTHICLLSKLTQYSLSFGSVFNCLTPDFTVEVRSHHSLQQAAVFSGNALKMHYALSAKTHTHTGSGQLTNIVKISPTK